MSQALVRNLVHAFRVRQAGACDESATLAELAIWSATADGVLDRAELADLAALLREVPGLTHFSDADAIALAESLRRFTSDDAIATRVTELALAIRSPEARRASYQLAVWSAARDGHLSEEEAAFLENLQDCLELDDDVVAQLTASVREP